MQITDTITDTIKNFDLTDVDLAKLGERVEEFGTTAVDAYADTSARVIDFVVDTNKKVVDIVVTNAERLPEAPFADRLPTAADAGERYLGLVEKAADFNRDLSRRVVDMMPAAAPAPKKQAAAKK